MAWVWRHTGTRFREKLFSAVVKLTRTSGASWMKLAIAPPISISSRREKSCCRLRIFAKSIRASFAGLKKIIRRERNLGGLCWSEPKVSRTKNGFDIRSCRGDWTGKKRDVPPIFRHFAEQCGFVEKKLHRRGFAGGGKAFCKETASGLLFHCWVDTGGFPNVAPRLPLEFFVSHVEDKFPPLGAGPDVMYVGAECYARFRTPENAIYGIYALVNTFDAFCSTFASSGDAVLSRPTNTMTY